MRDFLPISGTFEYHPRFGRTKKEKLPQYQGWDWGLAFVFLWTTFNQSQCMGLCLSIFWSRRAIWRESREKVLNIFQGFWASGLTGGSEGEMNFIGCCNSAQIPLKKKFPRSRFRGLFFLFRKSFLKSFYSWKIIKEYNLLKILSNACIVWERLGKALFPL